MVVQSVHSIVARVIPLGFASADVEAIKNHPEFQAERRVSDQGAVFLYLRISHLSHARILVWKRLGPILLPYLQDARDSRLVEEAAARMTDRGFLLLPRYIEYARSLPQRHDTIPLLPDLGLLIQYPLIHDIILEDRPITEEMTQQLLDVFPQLMRAIEPAVAQSKEKLLGIMKQQS